MSATTFGTLVRQWRDRLDPADAGFARTTRRRVPGLRREELADLAGLSVEYVLRLEQGRATNPSSQVVAAISRALQLTRSERDRLYHSAGHLPPQDGTIDRHVPPGVQRLAARLGDVPVGIFAADWTLLWWNDMWSALLGDPADLPPSERNVARMLFGVSAGSAQLRPVRSAVGQEAFEAAIVSDIKAAVSRYPAGPHLAALASGLRRGSGTFGQLWDTVGATELAGDEKIISNPVVGNVVVDCDVLTVPGADLRIVTYTAAAGTPDADKLDLLRMESGQALQARAHTEDQYEATAEGL